MAKGEYQEEADLLKRYRREKQAIENMRKRMAWLSSAPAVKDPEEERERLQHRIESKEEWCSLIEDVLSQLDPMNRAVIEKLYTGKAFGSMKQMCIDMIVPESTGYRWRKAALKEFAQLYGSESE